jgi:murein DD-endopeptidase MepM/ murein hydrolase activator NlpD
MKPATIRKLPKAGWLNGAARILLSLQKKPAPSRFLEYQTKTMLRLPFDGEWYVFWGGRSVRQNRHAVVPNQRFAYDFLILKDGQSFHGTGESNDDYYCFGQPIYAPGAGLVVAAAGEFQDNLPGVMDAKQPLGNYVLLDHGNGEFSFIAHLRQGSVRVQAGNRVEAGTLLGACGNSGHSSEPHLHFHLQNTSVLSRGEGLPAFFCNYVVRGKTVARGEPIARQTVRHAAGL